MSTFSAPPSFSTISSSDTITINSSTITSSGSGYYYMPGNNMTSGTISISNISPLTTAQISGLTIDTSMFNYKTPEEWEDKFPEWSRVMDMCKQYPGLQIAFEKFKTTYLLVKNHYDTPENERPLP